jgi:hypothetical protein
VVALNEIIAVAISYFVVLCLAIGIIGYNLQGFFITYFRVKFSRGKKIVVKVRDMIRPKYIVGHIEGEELLFKYHKDTKRINIERDDIYTDLKVQFVEVDPTLDCVINFGKVIKGVPGFDADKHNSLYLRCLYRPTLLDSKTNWILGLLILSLLLTVVVIGLGYQNMRMDKLLLQNLEYIRSVINVSQTIS